MQRHFSRHATFHCPLLHHQHALVAAAVAVRGFDCAAPAARACTHSCDRFQGPILCRHPFMCTIHVFIVYHAFILPLGCFWRSTPGSRLLSPANTFLAQSSFAGRRRHTLTAICALHPSPAYPFRDSAAVPFVEPVSCCPCNEHGTDTHTYLPSTVPVRCASASSCAG